MIFHYDVKKTWHYRIFHEKEFPFDEVIKLIWSAKSQRRKGNRIVIETKKAYVLCKIKNGDLYLINAKRK